MQSIIVLLALVAIVAAQVPKVYVRNPGPFTVAKGFSQTFTFSLDEPILCEDPHAYCAVVVLLTNPNVNDLQLDNCQVKWTNADWFVPRVVTVKATENFKDDGEKTYVIVTKPVVSASEYYSGFNPVDLTIKTQARPTRTCSATGDPHYTTFDGYYWHEYGPGQMILYGAPWRDFEIQARVFSRPALHCALAAREGNDVFYINRCPGDSMTPTINFNSPKDKQPIVSLSGSRYTVSFRSGAQLIFDMESYYMNVYVTAPGMDYGRTVGMCGDFDGNPNNDAPAYQVNDVSSLFASQRVTADLWAWKYTPSPVTSTLPPFASECAYVAPVISRPVLSNGDSEDITDLLKAIVQATPKPLDTFNFEDKPVDIGVTFAPIDEAAILKACNDAIANSNLGQVCSALAGINVQTYVDNCVLDIKMMNGDLRFVNDAFNAMQTACAEVAGRDLSTYVLIDGEWVPNPEITKNLCPNGCSGHGTCKNAVCTCQAGFMNVDCSHDSSKPPTVQSLTPATCDAQFPKNCPASVSVFGNNFFNVGTGITCRFGSTVTNATYVSPSQVICALPAYSGDRTVVFSQGVTVSNDGAAFSTDLVSFSWFDSVCHVCTGAACTSNPNACVVNGACYHALDMSAENTCMTCQPAKATTAFSFDYSNSFSCGPKFEEAQYTVNIVDVAKANTPVLAVHAVNKLVEADTANTITYSIGPNSNPLLTVNPTTGVVSTTADIVPSAINLQTFNARVGLVATDSKGNVASVNLFITFQGTNRAPVFQVTEYTFTVTENSAIGGAVGSVKATDPNAGQTEGQSLGWDIVSYSWILQEVGFGDYFTINNATGAITIARNIDFEAKASYRLAARAMDGGGMFSAADVYINVINVNEAPTAVALSQNTIAENSAVNTVVGALSTVDPESGDTHTYTLKTTGTPFAIVNKNIVATAALNFEATPNTFSLVVRSTDQGGLFVESTITVSVTDVNEAPTFQQITPLSAQVVVVGNAVTIKEDFAVNTPIATVTASDPDADQIVSCGIVGSSVFQISGNQIVLLSTLDFETAPSLSFKIACSDTGVPSLTSPFVTFTVTVLDANEGGQQVRLLEDVTIPENSAAGFVVGTISAVDPDSDASTLAFSTPSNDHFEFAKEAPVCKPFGTTGAKECTARLIVRGGLDFETKPIDNCQVVTVDNKGLVSTTSVAIKIGDVNEPPTGADLTSNLVEENAATGTVVGELLIIDADAVPSQYAVALLNSASGRFNLVKTTRDVNVGYKLVVADGSRIDFETEPQLTVSVSVADISAPANVLTFNVAITVTDKPMVPLFPTKSLNQNTELNRKVGVLSLDGLDRPELVPQYKLDGAHADYFTLAYDAVSRTANVLLTKSLNGADVPSTLSFIAVAAFKNDAAAPVQSSFSVAVATSNKAPIFVDNYPAVYVSDDAILGSSVVTVQAQDPEGNPLEYILTVSPSAGASLFTIDESSGEVATRVVPSVAGIPLQTYTLTIVASDGLLTATTTVTADVVDDCFAIPDAPVPCNFNGICTDAFRSYTCECNPGFTGNDCDNIGEVVPANNAASSAIAGGAAAGIAVAVVVIVILVIFVLLIVVRSRNNRKNTPIAAVDSDAQAVIFNGGFQGEAIYDQPDVKYVPSSDFEPGVENPMYAWYQPRMSRQDCEDYLAGQGEGSFVIRDSSFTPGWHMLAVKTDGVIAHERIKLNADGTYEMLPSTNVNQPKFSELGEMVEHYAECKRQGVSFSLAMDNPLYDNHLLREAPRMVRPLETIHEMDAPMVPVRDREREQVNTIAQISVEEQEMYTNTSEAIRVMSSC